MSNILFIWDKKEKRKSFIDLADDFKSTNSAREILIYGTLAIEEMCYFLYKQYLEDNQKFTSDRLKVFRDTKFAVKIDTLEILGVIDNKMAGRIRAIKDTRNMAAHNLVFDDIIYKEKPMPDGIEEFKKDCVAIWNELSPPLKGVKLITEK